MGSLILYVSAFWIFMIGTSGTLYGWLVSTDPVRIVGAYICIVIVLGAFIRAACEVFEITE